MIITPRQVAAARGVLRWTQAELARQAKAPKSVIALFETRRRLPASATLCDLKRALEAAGVEFIDAEPGVRLRAVEAEREA